MTAARRRSLRCTLGIHKWVVTTKPLGGCEVQLILAGYPVRSRKSIHCERCGK